MESYIKLRTIYGILLKSEYDIAGLLHPQPLTHSVIVRRFWYG